MTHACPVSGCDRTIPDDHLMCRAHWRRVPRPLAREVNESWREYRAARGTPAGLAPLERYVAARRQAVAWIESINAPGKEAAR